jgi:hypothetical protein
MTIEKYIMWKERVTHIATHLPVETEENHVKISSNSSLQAEIKTHDLTNAKQEK